MVLLRPAGNRALALELVGPRLGSVRLASDDQRAICRLGDMEHVDRPPATTTTERRRGDLTCLPVQFPGAGEVRRLTPLTPLTEDEDDTRSHKQHRYAQACTSHEGIF